MMERQTHPLLCKCNEAVRVLGGRQRQLRRTGPIHMIAVSGDQILFYLMLRREKL